MSIEIIQASPKDLQMYATIPMMFYADSAVDIKQSENGAFNFIERKLDSPYMKDYDSIMSPRDWEKQFDLSDWGFFVASQNNTLIGGAVIAARDNEVEMLDKREDLAVLWGK